MRTTTIFLLASITTLCSCGDKPGDDTAAVDTRTPGEDVTVTAFDGEHVYFGDENRRQVDVEVSFPDATTTYSSINGRFALRCPDEGCDHWDRYGTFGIVLDPGTESEQYIELDRHITPYRVGFSWEAELTDLRPTLTGTQTMRVFIDTWVGPGHDQGAGWLFDAAFDFVGGAPPSPEPIDNIPVWGHLAWNAGLDDQPVETQVVPTSVDVPAETTAATFRSFITGHGWNNGQNCAEFCEKNHYYTVGGSEFGRLVWRDDCSETVTDGTQQGTWTYSRAGWCPGAQVFPWDTDVSDMVVSGEAVDVSYRLEDFSWWGDGDQPYYYMSGMLIVYR